MRRCVLLVVIALPALGEIAAATPNAFGVGLGANSDVDSSSGDAGYVFDVFARAGVSERFGVQAELDRSSSTNADLTAATVAATFDLVDHSSFVPMFLGGAGLDWTSGAQSGEHLEVGAAIEYRAHFEGGGLLLGFDLRLGVRHVDASQPEPEPVEGTGLTDTNTTPAFVPGDLGSSLPSGGYGMARFYAGVHF